mmetsp:Transcript_38313/g.89440  ORF Transcript_38313/g.89440 Transcript_38313/m.89440 type:complete len:221 (+) Transcript_38313:908-1570(+)
MVLCITCPRRIPRASLGTPSRYISWKTRQGPGLASTGSHMCGPVTTGSSTRRASHSPSLKVSLDHIFDQGGSSSVCAGMRIPYACFHEHKRMGLLWEYKEKYDTDRRAPVCRFGAAPPCGGQICIPLVSSSSASAMGLRPGVPGSSESSQDTSRRTSFFFLPSSWPDASILACSASSAPSSSAWAMASSASCCASSNLSQASSISSMCSSVSSPCFCRTF